MRKKSKKLTSIMIILVALAVVYGAKSLIGASGDGLAAGSYAKVKGEDDAPLKITEFIDFECPACAHGAKYLKEIMGEHPGLIRLQLKHFPLQMHRYGLLSSQYAECASQQGEFWPYHDLLIERQGNWKQLADATPAFEQIAKEVGLDQAMLSSCLVGSKAAKIIEKNKLEGQSLQIRSTPTYFVNGEMVVGQKSLQLKIEKYLQENGN